MMPKIHDDIADWLSNAREEVGAERVEPSLNRIGSVRSVGDGVAIIDGLSTIRLDELLEFEDGSLGVAFRVGDDFTGCVLLAEGPELGAGTKVKGLGRVLRVPVGESLLGRVIDPTGVALDGGPDIVLQRHDPIDRPAPQIVDRDLVSEPLVSGITAIDTMIPMGRGQRELILGDRKTGKTALAVDTIIAQKSSDMICIYAAVGQRASAANQAIQAIREHGPIERTIFVISHADSLPGAQWLTPYAACTIGEYFRDQGKDVLLVIDDLTKHAIIYRQLSLLLRRPPGREAYPGDVFYLHARLLERGAKLRKELGGGSLSVLPIAETQSGNLTAYIPTNLISITDGQIYLEPKLFYEGQKPAINIGLSVSRVGGHAQMPALKAFAQTLKLDYAQFLELEVFTRFGAMVDARTKEIINHGRRIRAILSQSQFSPVTLTTQIALLIALSERKLDPLTVDDVQRFRAALEGLLADQCPEVVSRIEKTREVTEDMRREILAVIEAYIGHIPVSESKEGGASNQLPK